MKIMKRCTNVIVLLSVLAAGLLLSGSICANAADQQSQKNVGNKNDLAAQLIGTWILEKASTPSSPSGVGTRLKFFTGTHWCIIQPDPKTGVIIFQHGGRYTLAGKKVNITRDFGGEYTKTMIGKSGSFEIQIDGDTLRQADADGVYNETWKRAK